MKTLFFLLFLSILSSCSFQKNKDWPTFQESVKHTEHNNTYDPMELTTFKWKFKTEGSVWSSPAVADGVVYFGSWDNNLYAVDVNTGQEKWKFKAHKSISSSPAVVDGVVYFGSNGRSLYAVDINTEKEKWRYRTYSRVSSSPTVVDGVVYFEDNRVSILAVDINTGKWKWEILKKSNIVLCPAVADGVVYFGSDDAMGWFISEVMTLTSMLLISIQDKRNGILKQKEV